MSLTVRSSIDYFRGKHLVSSSSLNFVPRVSDLPVLQERKKGAMRDPGNEDV